MYRRSSIRPQTCAAVCASLIFICAGFHIQWLNDSLPKIKGELPFGMKISDEEPENTTFLFIGVICAIPFSVILVDTLGRRTILLLAMIPFVISGLLIAYARSYWWFYLARVFAGFGIGVAFTVTPMYIGEIAENRIRGGLGALMFVMLYIGGFILTGIYSRVNQADRALVGAVITIVITMALLRVPESPYYHAINKIPSQTQKNLAWLRGTPDVSQELKTIDNSIKLNQSKRAAFVNLFTVRSNQKALGIVLGLLTCQQLSNVLLIHAAKFFYWYEAVEIVPRRFFSTWVLMMLVSAITIVPLVDRVGRRRLLLTSASLCTFFSLATVMYLPLHREDSWILGILLMGYLVSYSIGIGPIPLVISGEFFPCEVKGLALGISTAYTFALEIGISYWFQSIITTYSYLDAINFLACFNIASIIFIFFFVPETNGWSLTEIQLVISEFQPNFEAISKLFLSPKPKPEPVELLSLSIESQFNYKYDLQLRGK